MQPWPSQSCCRWTPSCFCAGREAHQPETPAELERSYPSSWVAGTPESRQKQTNKQKIKLLTNTLYWGNNANAPWIINATIKWKQNLTFCKKLMLTTSCQCRSVTDYSSFDKRPRKYKNTSLLNNYIMILTILTLFKTVQMKKKENFYIVTLYC